MSGILGKKTVIDLSDESADQLEPVFPVIPPTSFYSSQSSVLEEFRNIREDHGILLSVLLSVLSECTDHGILLILILA